MECNTGRRGEIGDKNKEKKPKRWCEAQGVPRDLLNGYKGRWLVIAKAVYGVGVERETAGGGVRGRGMSGTTRIGKKGTMVRTADSVARQEQH